MIELRPYQRDCIEAIETADNTGTHRQLVALPTGTGKTIVFTTVAKKRDGRTLILAHRDELIQPNYPLQKSVEKCGKVRELQKANISVAH